MPNPPAAPAVRWKLAKSLAFSLLTSRLARFAVGATCGSGVPFRGTRIRPASRFSIEGPLLLSGKYERAEIDFVHRYLPRDRQVVELGASIGGTSCQIAARLAPGVRMTCVEGNPELIPVLEENLRRNHPGRPVEVVNAMIGGALGTGTMRLERSTLTSSAGGEGRSVTVPSLRLDDVVARIGGGPYSLVSDIEGAEVLFLSPRSVALDRCSCIVMEGHSTSLGGTSRNLEEVLALPEVGGRWRMADRYGAVAVYLPVGQGG